MSTPASQARLLTASLVLINVCVGAVLVYQTCSGTQAASLLAIPPKPFPVPKLDVGPAAPLPSLASIQEQSLFYMSRHFYTPPPPSALPATPPKPDYRLVGTFIIPAKPTVALLSGASGVSRKVKPGDNLDGWTVQVVEVGRVILQFQNTTAEIASAGKASAAGMRVVPLAQSNQVAPVSGLRTLGGQTQGSSISPAGYATSSSNPRLYRPPPK
jgi:hypothetical protein